MTLKSFINQRNIKKYRGLVQEIEKYYQTFNQDEQINVAQKLLELKQSTLSSRKKTLQAMALAKIASQQALGMSYYEVQLKGALALVDGAMAEMKTGEGKTLTCSAAVAANFALGYKTHVATANEYLAERDCLTLKKLYDLMGIKSAFNLSTMDRTGKQQAYDADVVYSTAQELGFDFLRDNLLYQIEQKLQPRDFRTVKCIIDEADFVLIDEARTPLIISGESPMQPDNTYHLLRDLMKGFKKITTDPNTISYSQLQFSDVIEDGDFWLDEKQRNIYFSEQGYRTLEKITREAGILKKNEHTHLNSKHQASLYDDENSWIINEAINALKAHYLFIRDKDYIVQDGEVVIIDQNTGRLSKGRTWSNGLHQAIEAKENLKINPETMTLGSISIQNYFRNYAQISGMSGTIMQSSEEFEEIYSSKTIQIPTNRKVVRLDHQDKIYLNAKSKYAFMIEDIAERHHKKQPMLIGTVSVAESEIISRLLDENKITHYVLNAKNHALEAQIIAQAGQPGRVTVATSMAGRGTDIILGGNKESLKQILDEQLAHMEERLQYANHVTSTLDLHLSVTIELQPLTNPNLETYGTQMEIQALYDNEKFAWRLEHEPQAIWSEIFNLKHRIEQQKVLLEASWKDWRAQVIEAGGLCVIGSSRNESRRIDDQIRGRAGRQGDPGESVFYMSLEDPWVNVFGKNAIFAHLMKTLPEDHLISAPSVSRIFAKAQHRIESHHFDIRKNTYQYDSIADEGRKRFLSLRDHLLEDLQVVKDIVQDKLLSDLSLCVSEDFLNYIEEHYEIEKVSVEDVLSYPLADLQYLVQEFEEKNTYGFKLNTKALNHDKLIEKIEQLSLEMDSEGWQKLNRTFVEELDSGWSNHLSFIDDAQRNVSFSALAQKNPVYEYRKICFLSFSNLLHHSKNKLVNDFITHVEPPVLEDIIDIEHEDTQEYIGHVTQQLPVNNNINTVLNDLPLEITDEFKQVV
jgi:preprotein translocase subunit SecA